MSVPWPSEAVEWNEEKGMRVRALRLPLLMISLHVIHRIACKIIHIGIYTGVIHIGTYTDFIHIHIGTDNIQVSVS